MGDNPDSVDAQGLSVYGLRIGAVGWFLPDGAWRVVSHHVGIRRLLLRHGQRARLDLHCAGDLRQLRPGKALRGALLFGAYDAPQVRLQTEFGALVPGQVFLMAPYNMSIIALVIAARKADYSRALLTPWFKGRR